MTNTPVKLLQLRFWTDWIAYLQAHKSPIRPQTPRPQHWLNITIGRAGFVLVATINSREGRIGAEVYIGHTDSKTYFAAIEEKRTAIEDRLGFALEWQELPNRQASRIAIFKSGLNLEDESEWSGDFGWLMDTVQKLDNVLRPIIKSLP